MFDDISEDDYKTIESAIESASSPVGIDAKKTHVLILHKLLNIERRLTELEQRAPLPTPPEPNNS
ncbi:MAG: hypothetical protein K8J08_15375 [Thermoanaerobaculia bacterium]|nr:hypothetical protein [Thermoanaerobaculia bacterium]